VGREVSGEQYAVSNKQQAVGSTSAATGGPWPQSGQMFIDHNVEKFLLAPEERNSYASCPQFRVQPLGCSSLANNNAS